MKKLLVTMAIGLVSMTSLAAMVKYSAIYSPKTLHEKDALDSAGVKLNDEIELSKAKVVDNVPVTLHFVEGVAGFDDFLLKFIKSTNANWVFTYATEDNTPKTFAYLFSPEMKDRMNTYLVTGSGVPMGIEFAYETLKSEKVLTTRKVSTSTLITLANNKYLVQPHSLRDTILKDAVRQIKIWYRKNGKTFVAKRDASGTVVDPIAEPFNEIKKAVNAPMMAGLNEWIDKYDVRWPHIDLSWIGSEGDIVALKEAILIDEVKFDGVATAKLDIALGSKALEAFVDEYNNGKKDASSND